MAKLFPLNINVELLIAGTWNDVSSYVYQRDGIEITGGRQNRDDQLGHATATVTLNNRDGRFSPLNTAGAYYPNLKRNQQIRISVNNATSSSGNTYTGYRFWGEVPDWPPQWDVSGEDVFTQIEATGPLRRFRKHGGKGSALQRYYAGLTGNYAPVAYWPCEEDPDANQVQAGLSGGQQMSIIVGTPKWKTVSNFNGSAPIGILNKSTWTGVTGSFGASGDDIYTSPGTYQWISPVSTVEARCWGGGGGGHNGTVGTGGGGGEFRKNTAVAVTPGQAYTVVVGAGGAGGLGSPATGTGNNGADGTDSVFTGDAVSVLANNGQGGQGTGGGAGGTGGTGTTGFAGGAGGSNPSNVKGAAGGGGSAGTAAGGSNGASPSDCSGAAGGAAVAGGGKGGRGGDGCQNPSQGSPGAAPGGGGGGGGDSHTGYNWAGGAGATGKVELIYSAGGALPTKNVMRFILFVPKHGGNSNAILVKYNTGSAVIASLEVSYVSGGKLRLQGFNGAHVSQFDSGAQAWSVNNRTVMVSVELSNSGANVAWAFRAVEPGAKTLIGSASGTVATAAVGSVSLVTVAPNADITKTAMGHFSVQYALIDLRAVSRHLHGHHTEVGVDRFVRMLTEEALGNETVFAEAGDHWGFEAGTQSWVAANGALTNPTTAATPANTFNIKNNAATWPTEGTHSLLLTASGAGSPSAHSPSGTSGLNILAGDQVALSVDIYTPAAQSNIYCGIQFYTAAGAAVGSEFDSADYVTLASEMATLDVKAIAPATAAFFAVFAGNHGAIAAGQLIYIDHVRVHPRMGPQTRKKWHELLEEIEELDQGILKESRKLWGLGYRTRVSMINQSPVVTLDYSAKTLSPPLAPVHEAHKIKNDITVHRHKGSKVRVTLETGGDVSVQEPPAGAGRHRHRLKVAAESDEQILALASQLLSLGTTINERYPTITINMGRCGLAGQTLAPLMSAVAGVEVGDMIRMTSLPFWCPNATANQLVIGYSETLTPYEWIITWNCIAELPFEVTLTNLRRW